MRLYQGNTKKEKKERKKKKKEKKERKKKKKKKTTHKNKSPAKPHQHSYSSNSHGFITQRWVIPHRHSSIESIHVHMHDGLRQVPGWVQVSNKNVCLALIINNIHLSRAHWHPECSHDAYIYPKHESLHKCGAQSYENNWHKVLYPIKKKISRLSGFCQKKSKEWQYHLLCLTRYHCTRAFLPV